MTKSGSLKCILALGLLILAQFGTSLPAHATACDAAFMTKLRERAWQMAQNEIQTNETVINKPDSVFALSCFGDALNRLPAGFNNGGAAATTQPARDAASAFVGAAFPHNMLIGTNNVLTTGTGPANSNLTTCGAMSSVWQTAKCGNLDAGAFANTALGTNSRGANGGSCGATGTWAAVTSAPDAPNLFLGVTDPFSLLSPSTCSRGIETGVVVGNSGASYKEVVCPNPGCVPVLGTGSPASMKCCSQNNPSSGCSP